MYGADWRGLIPDRFIKGDYFPNDQLSELYASAGVVLNDHWKDMRDKGFISNRVFDVLASGGVMLTDEVAGMTQLLDNGFVGYSDETEFRRELKRLLNDEESRSRLSSAGPRLAESHSFDARAMEFAELVTPLLRGRSMFGGGGV